MILVENRDHQPDPQECVYRGIEHDRRSVFLSILRFSVFSLVVVWGVQSLPSLAGLLLDPSRLASTGAGVPSASTARALAWGLPLLLVLVAWGLALTQRRFAFEGRRLALRKQAWVLYGEFREAIAGHFEDDEEPIGYRVVDPPELSSSLLFRLAFFWLTLELILLAVITPLALRIHWPTQGHHVWYLAMGLLSSLSLVALASFRSPPVLRLFIQSAVPALHFGHGLVLGGSTLTPLGVPALALDLVLGLLTGIAGYYLGQRERGGSLLVLTTHGAHTFDPAGRETYRLGAVHRLDRIVLQRTPAGARADFLDAEGEGLRGLAFEGPESIREMPERLAERGVSVTLEELPPADSVLAVTREPGLLGWSLIALLVLASGRLGQDLLTWQRLLREDLMVHLGTWSRGNPSPLHQGAVEALAEHPGFYPAQVLRALTRFDLGAWEDASREILALTQDRPLHGFAARTLPERRRWVEELYALALATPDPDELLLAEAQYLLSEVSTPHASRLALVRLSQLSGDLASSPRANLLRGLAHLDRSSFPEARITPEGGPEAVTEPDLQLARRMADLLPSREAAFLEASMAFAEDDPDRALEAVGDQSQLADLVGPRSAALVGRVLFHMLPASVSAPEVRARARALLDQSLRSLGPEASRRHDLDLALLVFGPPEEARQGVVAVRATHPDRTSPWLVLADEVAGEVDWASYDAFRLLGTRVLSDPDPRRIPELASVPPLLQRYLLALALQSLRQEESSRALLRSLSGSGSFPWPGWLERRGV